MINLTRDYIRKRVANSSMIYLRGVQFFENGTFTCTEADFPKGKFIYKVDGNYGDYTTRVQLLEDGVKSWCNCPYPERGCKHTVAVLLDVCDRMSTAKSTLIPAIKSQPEEPYLTPEEIRKQAIEDRKNRAKQEQFKVTLGEMYKGEHLVETPKGRQYVVTLHDPQNDKGHCTCPDFLTNRLNTCKHMIRLCQEVKKQKDFTSRMQEELFPFADIYWDSACELPRLFCERPRTEMRDLQGLLSKYFDQNGLFTGKELSEFLKFFTHLNHHKRVKVQDNVLQRLDDFFQEQQLRKLAEGEFPSLSLMKIKLYPYQELGVKFALHKRATLIGDEMGLGKTLQAIALAILKREVFDFNKVLVVTLTSLKEQWKREIERFTDEKAILVEGGPRRRRSIYEADGGFFKITNYEAVLRDITILSDFRPDLVILDEAQRIKNFSTKTAEVVKSIPRKHSLILTGTPLENRLEDIYSIVQFLDPHMLAPLWKFTADHFRLSREKKGKVLGYHNLDLLHEKLKTIVIRRKKEEVLSDLPDEVVNNYYLELDENQQRIHAGFLQSLAPLLHKKFLTPMDLKRIQDLLLCMRMVCDSTFLIDRKTNISPKMKELESILEELVLQNGRKVVIFSEWTTMTFLIGKHLSQAGIPFVELSGKIPVKKRQALIDEFTNNPNCKVFLSTDAGGTGLNLQAGDCVINFELPWNPARMRQRIARVNRIGQKSRCVNVVNLITKHSIEERILTGIQLKTDLFKGVFEGETDVVEFSQEKRSELLNQLKEMMGESPQTPRTEPKPAMDLPEDTPHYLNPQILKEQEQPLAYNGEEEEFETVASTTPIPDSTPEVLESEVATADEAVAVSSGQSPEKMEEVLSSGMQFLSGLLEMATGKKLEPTAEDQRMIRIDKETGEVTLKFKLPRF